MLKDSYIYLRNLRFHAFHGVEAQERMTGNDYELNLRIQVNVSAAMVSDNVTDTVNYAEVYSLAKDEMAIPSNLVEHVAYRIGKSVMKRWPAVCSIKVCLTKLNPPMGADCDGAGVELYLINDKTEDL
jgi:dihydroneopterin aldolase